MSGEADEVELTVRTETPDDGFGSSDFDPALLIGSLAFAAIGAVLGLVVSMGLRPFATALGRRGFIATATVCVVALGLLAVALLGWAVRDRFSFDFLLQMRWQGWALFLAGTLAGLLVARRFAPSRPLRVDPSVFE